jgi:hypothetical protein
MKISKLSKFAWIFFVLATGTTTLFAQGWRNGNRAFVQNNQNAPCLTQITDLTQEQSDKIAQLNKKHQEAMTELRDERRSTTDLIEKNEIRGTMLKKVNAHREEVKGLLTDEQQKQYDQFYARGNNFGSQRGNGNFRGRGQFRGQQGFAANRGNGCRGNRNGNGQRMRDNSCPYIQNNN